MSRLTLDNATGYRSNSLDLPGRRAPLGPGEKIVSGRTSDGYSIATRVRTGTPDAERLAGDAAERRQYMADRRRLAAIFDDKAHVAEKADLLARLSRPTWPTHDH